MDPEYFNNESFVNEDVITMAVNSINTTSANWLSMFMQLAMIIFTVIAALEFMKEALKIAQGKEHNLIGKLIRYAMVGVLIIAAPTLVKGFKQIPITTLDFMEFNRAKAEELGREIIRIQQDQNILESIWSATKNLLMGPIYLLGQLFYFIASVMTTMIYVSYAFIFNVILALAPIAFPFLLSDDLKELFVSWITNVLSYSITFPLIAIGINIIMEVQLKLMYTEIVGVKKLNFMQIAIMSLIVSISSMGIIMAAVKTAKHLTGSGGGGAVAMVGVEMAMRAVSAVGRSSPGTPGVGRGGFMSSAGSGGATLATGGGALAAAAVRTAVDITEKAVSTTMKAAGSD